MWLFIFIRETIQLLRQDMETAENIEDRFDER